MSERAQAGGARPAEHTADGAETLARDLADITAARLRAAVSARGAASLVVSGGRTPAPMFRALRACELPWERVTVTLADERWVPADAADSNERMVRAELLQGAAAAARFVGLVNAAPTPEAGRAATDAALRAIPRPFDVVMLGMGNDGHTASLFPDAPALAAALAPALAAALAPGQPDGQLDGQSDGQVISLADGQVIGPAAGQADEQIWLCAPAHPASVPQARMTMTLVALLDSRDIFLHLVGADKRAVYEQALAGADVAAMPVRAVLGQDQVPVTLFWAP